MVLRLSSVGKHKLKPAATFYKKLQHFSLFLYCPKNLKPLAPPLPKNLGQILARQAL